MMQPLLQWHEHDQLVSWAQRAPGRLGVWAVAAALLLWNGDNGMMVAAFTAVMLHPERRRLYLSIAAAGMLAQRFLELPDLPPSAGMPWLSAVLAATVGTGMLYVGYLLARRSSAWPALVQRHPVLTIHAGVWLLLWAGTIRGLGALGLVTFFSWRVSYLAASVGRGNFAGTRFRDHLFYLVPVYGGTNTPYGKGLDFLARHEAGDARSIALSQLAGIKLLVLAVAWTHARELLDVVFFGNSPQLLATWPTSWISGLTLGWPTLVEVMRSGTFPVWYLGWTTAFLQMIRATLALAAMGHVIVGCLRLVGFNVFRNTYKPLLSESILEFWNRYYYYFKELLTEFFFFPTLLRLRGLSPRTRMVAAVFVAALVGNMYYHVMVDPQHVVHFDLEGLWDRWSPRLVYCFLLASGISVSMLRQQTLRATGVPPRPRFRLRRIAGVWMFFAIIQIWNVNIEGVGIRDCTAFFLSLFGV